MNICIVRRAGFVLLPTLLGLVTLTHASLAVAQSSHIISASVETCNVRAVVRTTVLGVTTTVPLACVNSTAQTAPGQDNSALVGTLTVGVPGVANVATVTGPFGESSWVDAPLRTQLVGESGASTLSVAQGGVQIRDVVGRMTCDSASDGDVISCAAETTVGAITVGGRTLVVPAHPIPVNHTIAVTGLRLGVNVLGLQLAIPVNGQLVLNRVKVVKAVAAGVELAFEHAPLALTLSGSVHLLGIGLVRVDLEVLDFTSIEVKTSP